MHIPFRSPAVDSDNHTCNVLRCMCANLPAHTPSGQLFAMMLAS